MFSTHCFFDTTVTKTEIVTSLISERLLFLAISLLHCSIAFTGEAILLVFSVKSPSWGPACCSGSMSSSASKHSSSLLRTVCSSLQRCISRFPSLERVHLSGRGHSKLWVTLGSCGRAELHSWAGLGSTPCANNNHQPISAVLRTHTIAIHAQKGKEKYFFPLISWMQYFQGKINVCISPRCRNHLK